ncbi:MAG: hypothetical protein M3R24_33915, partial [Chloroflexota bacterium]|nr:hypothetical protein [Chloroflexota bacterium]
LPQRPSSHPDWSAGTCRPATQTGSSADKTCCLISTPFLYGSETLHKVFKLVRYSHSYGPTKNGTALAANGLSKK